jgi:repressor LexA
LTPRQQQVLAALRESIARTGLPPTRAELASLLGLRSANAAEEHLRALARKGAISLLPGASRGIQILIDAARVEMHAERLPVIGRVAAGQPIASEAHVEDWQQIAPEVFHPRADFLLRVQGASMQDAGILDGDLLAVHATREARNGQIVVARVDDEVTVKRLRRQGHDVVLEPANAAFAPLRIDLRAQTLVVEGLGVGVIRNRPL